MEVRDVATTTQLATVDILCNICGGSCLVEIGPECTDYSYAKLTATWGYGSPKDTEQHKAHVCEPCYDAKIAPLFTIDPRKHNQTKP